VEFTEGQEAMTVIRSEPLRPKALHKEGAERLIIDWNDGHRSVYSWQHLRTHCPCASCRDQRAQPPDPFRILSAKELTVGPLAPVAVTPIGHYAYQITWSDGHDTGIYTLEHLRELCQCDICTKANQQTAN
jgi:DUF971 family protein